MNRHDPDAALDALFAKARAHRADTSTAEFAFETRLLARLRGQRDGYVTWALVSWRLAPIFAVCVLLLAFWQAEIVSEAHDAEQIAYLDNSTPADSWNSLN